MKTATEARPKQELQTVPFNVPTVAFDVSMQQIAELREEYMALTITDVTDKKQIAAVDDARILCKKLRVGMEKIGKAARDGFNKAAKDVIAQERSLTDPISEIEKHLESELGKVKAAEEAKKREAEAKRQAIIEARGNAIAGCAFPGCKFILSDELATMTQEVFESLLADRQQEKKAYDDQQAAAAAEQARIAAEQKAEAERLAKAREEFEAEEKKRRDRNNLIAVRVQALASLGETYEDFDALGDMPRDKWLDVLFGAQLAKQQRDAAAADEQARLDKQRKEQAEQQAKIDAEKQRLADEKAARELQERQAAEAVRVEALKPDREKLLSVSDAVDAIKLPDLSPKSGDAGPIVRELLDSTAEKIRKFANRLGCASQNA